MSKRIPQRMCVCCRKMFDKQDLIRIVRTQDGFDIDRNSNGRSAYVCKDTNCIEKTINKHTLNRSFKQNVPTYVYEKLEKVGKFDADK